MVLSARLLSECIPLRLKLKRIYNALRVFEFVKRRWLMLIIFIQSQRLPFLNSVLFSIGGLMEYYSGKYLPLVCAEKITLLT